VNVEEDMDVDVDVDVDIDIDLLCYDILRNNTTW
jgi:hypothetical protein